MASIESTITIKLDPEDRAQLARLERLLKGHFASPVRGVPLALKSASFRLELMDGSVIERTLERAEVSRLTEWAGSYPSEIEEAQGVAGRELDGTRGFELRVVGFAPRTPR